MYIKRTSARTTTKAPEGRDMLPPPNPPPSMWKLPRAFFEGLTLRLRQEDPSICPHCPTEDRVASLIHMCAFLRFHRSSPRKDPCVGFFVVCSSREWIIELKIIDTVATKKRNFQFFRRGEKRNEGRERNRERKKSIINNNGMERNFQAWKTTRNSIIRSESRKIFYPSLIG